MNKKKLSLLIIFILGLVFTVNVKAVTVTETKLWSSSSHLNLQNVSYNTRKGSGSLSRKTEHIGKFKDGDDNIWFCVEPGTPLESGNKITGASKTGSRPTKSNGWTWDVTEKDEKQLARIFSCWYNNNYSVVATQVIAWELVTEERYNILSDKILSGTYKPYLKDGSSTFGANSGVTSLYELIANVGSGEGKLTNATSRKKLFKAYKEVLECAARFDKNPSKSYSDRNDSVKNAVKLSNYSASTKTFSTTISDKLLNYYKIESGTCGSGFSCSLKDGKLTISTKKESATMTLTLRYSYITKDGVDGAAHGLKSTSYDPSTNGVQYLLKDTSTSPKPQAMARGSKSKVVYVTFKSGTNPKYQLKLTKTDDSTPKKSMSGVSFYICSANSIKSGQSCNSSNKIDTITTNGDGVAISTKLDSIGQYVAQEVTSTTPAGYVPDTTPANFSVNSSNVAGTASYASASRPFVNKKRHLKMIKRTLDTNGNVVDLTGDACPKTTCTNQGPIFTITSGGKKVCVKDNSTVNTKHEYVFSALRDTCVSGEKEEIETCNGAFDIELIPAGTYIVTEKYAPCNMTLPDNNGQTVVVKQGTPVTTVTMLNGVTGLVFTKVTEDGTPLDGGKFALQRKNNGIYEDMLLVHVGGVVYEYKDNATTDTANATYLLDTTNGIINVKGLPKGEYRMVEKQAPSGYDLIREKDSTAKVTISDAARSTDYYQIKLVNQKTTVEGSADQAEIVVTIKTGRNVINYPLVVGAVLVVLVGAIIIRKKMKK